MLLIVALAAATPTATACPDAALRPVLNRAPKRARPLSSEPPAAQVRAVLREENGCARPVVVRRDVGAPAR